MYVILVVGALSAQVRAEGCEGPIGDYIAEVRARHTKEAYLCLVERDDAGQALLDEIASSDPEDDGQSSVTRALAVHLMPRLGRFLTDDEVRALNAADRRLLRDAIRARRGRETPSADHAVVFEQFDWYEPDSQYTDGRLDHVDRANMDLLDSPPPAPLADEAKAQEPALAAMNEAQRSSEAGSCGCSTGATGLALWWLPLVVVGRRR